MRTQSNVFSLRLAQVSSKALFSRLLRTPIEALFEKLPSRKKLAALKKELASRSHEIVAAKQTHERREAVLGEALRNSSLLLRTANATIGNLREMAHVDQETRFMTSTGATDQLVTIAMAVSRVRPTSDDISWFVFLFAPEDRDVEGVAAFRRIVSDFLRTRFRFQGDTIARLGENEFALFLVAGDDLSRVMQRVISELTAYLKWLTGPDHKSSWDDVPIMLRIGLMNFCQTQSTNERRSPEKLQKTIEETLSSIRGDTECARFNIPRNW